MVTLLCPVAFVYLDHNPKSNQNIAAQDKIENYFQTENPLVSFTEYVQENSHCSNIQGNTFKHTFVCANEKQNKKL